MAKVIHNGIIPFGSYSAINLFGLIFVKHGIHMTRKDMNHELIHSRQATEMLWIFFYLWYMAEWLIKTIIYRSHTKAYYNISFEREAYENQSDLLYRRNRPFYAWIHYLRKEKRQVPR